MRKHPTLELGERAKLPRENLLETVATGHIRICRLSH